MKAIDCERGSRDAAALVDAIVDELLNGGVALDVGLRADGTRITLESVAAAVKPELLPRIHQQSVIVASGGARGVTAAALIALAEAYRPRIVLIGRSPPIDEPEALRAAGDDAAIKRVLIEQAQITGRKATPIEIGAEAARIAAAREVRATLDALRRAGSQAKYCAADVLDADALRTVLEQVRSEWGPITGIVHGAGVLADKKIVDKTDEQFDRVFDTKVKGLRALLAATDEDPLSVICVFSSIAARTGNVGQSDYAMANAVLSHVACAERARRPQCLVRSIKWGAWQGGMVNAALAEHFRRQGVALIPLAAGARAFVAELAADADDVRVVIAASDGLAARSEHDSDMDVHIDTRSHAYLADHAIGGSLVVPVALVLEWFARAAHAWRPASGPVRLRNVRVLRKMGLEHFGNGGDHFRIHGHENGRNGHALYTLELRGEGDAQHYRASADDDADRAESSAWQLPADLEPWPRNRIYDGHTLFHGPRFQALRTLEGVSHSGAAAMLVGARELGWSDEHWQTDPAVIDGGLQLAVLWAEHELGGASLPMAVAECSVYKAGLADAPIHCVVRARGVHDARAVCDIAFLDGNDTLRAELLGVEVVLRPGEPKRPGH